MSIDALPTFDTDSKMCERAAISAKLTVPWKDWFVLMILVEGYELAQAIVSPR
jgi:hypothetical protein